jgi:hypothetical protein
MQAIFNHVTGSHMVPASLSVQHEPDHRENDKTDVVAGEVLVVFSEASAMTEPAVGPLNDPALGQELKALGRVRALDASVARHAARGSRQKQ